MTTNWHSLTSEEQLLSAIKEEGTLLLFKHSTRCSISSMAKERLERKWNFQTNSYYLDLLQYRSVSNFISSYFNVEHASPQVLLIKDGKCIYHNSHSAIDPVEMQKLVA